MGCALRSSVLRSASLLERASHLHPLWQTRGSAHATLLFLGVRCVRRPLMGILQPANASGVDDITGWHHPIDRGLSNHLTLHCSISSSLSSSPRQERSSRSSTGETGPIGDYSLCAQPQRGASGARKPCKHAKICAKTPLCASRLDDLSLA